MIAAKKPAKAGLLASAISLRMTYLNPRADVLSKISENNLKYSQILESDRRDWFDSDCVTDVPWAGSSSLIFG